MLEVAESPSSTATWSAGQASLYQAVLEAHGASATRSNISHEVLKLAMIGSGSYMQAIAAALMSLGGMHAPLAQTYDLLHRFNTLDVARSLYENGQMIPGWGNAFVKGAPDPLWAEADRYLRVLVPGTMERMDEVTAFLHQKGKHIYPNPSCWTAAAGIALGFDRQTTGYLFVQGRLPAWTRVIQEILRDED